ncbi:MAG: hypothetical protein JWM90_649 [Thermoleophilia bacterium]|nr:hypothetical protein [Thermoleophilia bacterium]
MTNARLQKETGAVKQPGSWDHGTASEPSKGSATGCPSLHVELYRNTARLYGARIPQLLDQAGVDARQYDRERRCWTVSVNRADDVICIAEYRQKRFVTVEEVSS